MAFDPDTTYWQISQNFLLPGGSSILHPHLQVIGDPIPTNEMEWLLDGSSSYYQYTCSEFHQIPKVRHYLRRACVQLYLFYW
jgi:galactose-1-phosphate uridylyltransferase